MTMSNDELQEIASTIYQQLGGAGFSMMIGMKSPILVSEDPKLCEVTATFLWKAHAKNGLNCLEVTLVLSSDTYRVAFGKIKNGSVVSRTKPIEDVYCEDLHSLFQQATGLITIPPRIYINGIEIQHQSKL